MTNRVAAHITTRLRRWPENSCKNFAEFFAKEFAAHGTDAALWLKFWKVPDDP